MSVEDSIDSLSNSLNYSLSSVTNSIGRVGDSVNKNTLMLDKIFFNRYWVLKRNITKEMLYKRIIKIEDNLNFLKLIKEVFTKIGIRTMSNNIKSGYYIIENDYLTYVPNPNIMNLASSLSMLFSYDKNGKLDKDSEWRDYPRLNMFYFFEKIEENRLDKMENAVNSVQKEKLK